MEETSSGSGAVLYSGRLAHAGHAVGLESPVLWDMAAALGRWDMLLQRTVFGNEIRLFIWSAGKAHLLPSTVDWAVANSIPIFKYAPGVWRVEIYSYWGRYEGCSGGSSVHIIFNNILQEKTCLQHALWLLSFHEHITQHCSHVFCVHTVMLHKVSKDITFL